MYIISSTQAVHMRHLTLHPFVRYVVPRGPAQQLSAALTAKGALHTPVSSWNNYHRPYAAHDLDGKRLAIYRHAAWGDQLITTGVVAYLRSLYPDAGIDVYCSPDVLPIWKGVPVDALAAPMTFEGLRAYDRHLLYDAMLEMDSEPEQDNAYDAAYRFAGFDPDTIPPEFKRPHVVSSPADWSAMVEAVGCFPKGGRYVVIQLQASNPNRTYPPGLMAKVVEQFLAAMPEWRVVLVGQHGKRPEPWPFTYEHPRLLNVVGKTPDFRALIPLVQHAGLVVCPDSAIGHLAAAFPAVPVLSLWGLFDPADRIKYYRNHRPIWMRNVCPHSPCRSHEFKLPEAKCEDAVGDGPLLYCRVLQAIEPQLLANTMMEIVS